MAAIMTDVAMPKVVGQISAELVLPLGHFYTDELQEAHPEKWAHILHPDPVLTRAFLAEETLRLGGRGREIVGLVFDGEHELPLTGCEGYFVGTRRQPLDPPQLGRQIGEPRTPADIVRVIARLGALLLGEVERDLDSRYMPSRDTTVDEILRWIEAREMDEALLRCLNGVYGGILGVLHADDNPALVAFRDVTYRLLAGMPHPEVVASDDAITLRYHVPHTEPVDLFTTRVTLDRRLRHGYAVMAAVNPYLGNPVTRTFLQSDE
jgi:hypothetical protein